MGGLNLTLLRNINGWPETWSPFLRFFSEAMNRGWFKIAVLVLFVAMVARNLRTRCTAIGAVCAVLIANGTTDLWKHGLPEPRPFQELTDVILRAGYSNSAGTASAHAANMAAVATVFTVRHRWWGVPWVLAAILTGFSRVYVGVHYPYQVLLGWTCGGLAGLLVLWVIRYATTRSGGVRSTEPHASSIA